jgi:hypothetical protein
LRLHLLQVLRVFRHLLAGSARSFLRLLLALQRFLLSLVQLDVIRAVRFALNGRPHVRKNVLLKAEYAVIVVSHHSKTVVVLFVQFTLHLAT